MTQPAPSPTAPARSRKSHLRCLAKEAALIILLVIGALMAWNCAQAALGAPVPASFALGVAQDQPADEGQQLVEALLNILSEREQLKIKLADAEGGNARLATTIEDLEQQLAAMNQQIAALTAEIERLKAGQPPPPDDDPPPPVGSGAPGTPVIPPTVPVMSGPVVELTRTMEVRGDFDGKGQTFVWRGAGDGNTPMFRLHGGGHLRNVKMVGGNTVTPLGVSLAPGKGHRMTDVIIGEGLSAGVKANEGPVEDFLFDGLFVLARLQSYAIWGEELHRGTVRRFIFHGNAVEATVRLSGTDSKTYNEDVVFEWGEIWGQDATQKYAACFVFQMAKRCVVRRVILHRHAGGSGPLNASPGVNMKTVVCEDNGFEDCDFKDNSRVELHVGTRGFFVRDSRLMDAGQPDQPFFSVRSDGDSWGNRTVSGIEITGNTGTLKFNDIALLWVFRSTDGILLERNKIAAGSIESTRWPSPPLRFRVIPTNLTSRDNALPLTRSARNSQAVEWGDRILSLTQWNALPNAEGDSFLTTPLQP